jgi:endonuclease YncB( thermonuclease family)
MKNKWAIAAFVACMAFVSARLLLAGDSLYGKVTEVKSADTVLFDYGRGTYVVHLMGVAPSQGRMAAPARDFVAKMVQGKGARVRLGSFNENHEMYARLLADDPKTGVRDVGLELVRSGFAQRAEGQDYQFDYKYNELSTAQREAQRAQRGLWAVSELN